MAEESAERRAEARLHAEDVLATTMLRTPAGKFYERESKALARAYLDLEEALRLSEQREAELRKEVDGMARAPYGEYEAMRVRMEAAEQREAREFAERVRNGGWGYHWTLVSRAYLDLEEALRLSEQREAAGREMEQTLALEVRAAELREAALRQACLDALKMVNQGMWEEAMVTLSLAAQQPESEAGANA